jgi:Asp-tRNA(Asn)/Glu-tRNA(Gln) amidotransferase A subunit family amidase
MDFRQDSVRDLATAVRGGAVSARQLVELSLDRIDACNGDLNAFVAVDGEAALAAADGVDALVATGTDPGPLAGVPIGVKDLEDAAGFVTTQGSMLFADQPAAATDSLLVSRLKAAGAIVVGKTNTPELGWKGDTENRLFGATRNPWDLTRSPGGSSGGSAAAVAAGLVPLATGSDGGGSLRIPSALCGLSGFKPSLGRVPAGGAKAPGWQHLSTLGVMARRTSDLALALDAVVGPHPTDLRSLPMPEAPWAAAVDKPHVPMRVAWSPTLGYAEVDAEVLAVCERAVATLSDLGAEVVRVDDVFAEDPGLAWMLMANVYNLRTTESFRETPSWEQLDPGLRRQLERVQATPAVDLVRSEDLCHTLNLRLVELFHQVRLLVTPTTASAAPRCGGQGEVNGVETPAWVAFTYPFNMTRSPAGTVMAGLTGAGLPVGLQLVGPQHGEVVVLRAMAALEAALGLPALPPFGG